MWYDAISSAGSSSTTCDNVEVLVAQLNISSDNARYLDAAAAGGGDGLTQDAAWNDLNTAITAINAMGDVPKILYVKPGAYSTATGETITADYTYIFAGNYNESSMINDGSVTTILTINAAYCYIYGLQIYGDGTGIRFDDTGGGTNGNFNVVENCTFRSLVTDDMVNAIRMEGSEGNIIKSCYFQACSTSGIILVDGVTRIRIENCIFVGCADNIRVVAAAYNVLSRNNVFIDGSETAGENYTASIVTTAGYTAGSIVSENDSHQGAAAANAYVHAGAGALEAINPQYLISVP